MYKRGPVFNRPWPWLLNRHKRVLIDHGHWSTCYVNILTTPFSRVPAPLLPPEKPLNHVYTFAYRKNHRCQRPDLVAIWQWTSKSSVNPIQIQLVLLRIRWYSLLEDTTCLSPLDCTWYRLTTLLKIVFSEFSIGDTDVKVWLSEEATWKRSYANTQG